MKRDPSVELARLFACLIVIGVHVALSATINGVWDSSRTFIAMFVADGVSIFWMITGFFLFQNKSYPKLLKRTGRTILLPMAGLSLFVFFFGPALLEGATLSQSISHPFSDYVKIFSSLIRWSNQVSGCGHLWYLYVHVLVILVFPILKSFVSYLDESSVRKRNFLIVSFVFLVCNDLSNNHLGQFSHHPVTALLPASIFVIWGHLLYQQKHRFAKKRYLFLCPAAFLFMNGIRTLIQLSRGAANAGNAIMYWYSSFGLLCALCVIIFCFSLIRRQERTKPNQCILFLASYTFPIYLIHMLIRNMLNVHFSLAEKLQSILLPAIPGIFGEIIYLLSMIGIIFIISLCVSILLRQIKRFILFLVGKRRNPPCNFN